MVPPEETIVRRLNAKTAPALAEAKKKESNPRLKAAEARVAEREFISAEKAKTAIIEEEKVISAARGLILGLCGKVTPNDLAKSGRDIRAIAGKMANALSTILVPVRLVQKDLPPILVARMGEKMPGILSELRVHQDAVAKLQEYISYWQSIQQTGKLPGFWNFSMHKYNVRPVIEVIDGFFGAEAEFAQKLFAGLDYLYNKVIMASMMKKQQY
jgi:hypothetical protein